MSDEFHLLPPFIPTERKVEGIQIHTLEESRDYCHQIVYGIMEGYGIRNKMRDIHGRCHFSLRYNTLLLMQPYEAMEVIRMHPDTFDISPEQIFYDENDVYITVDNIIDIVGISGDLDYAMHLYKSYQATLKELAEEEGIS